MLAEALHAEAEILTKEIAALDTKRKRLELIRQLLHTYEEDPAQPPLFERSASEAGKPYAAAQLTDAVLDFIKKQGGRVVTPKEVRDGLLVGGFHSNSPNLLQMVANVCIRKSVPGGPLISASKGDARAFALNPVYAQPPMPTL